MRCLFCGSEQSAVLDKRPVKSKGEIRRRRECLKCHRRFTTYEKMGNFELYVIKRDGRRELFNRDKIRNGLMKSLEKRPGVERIELIVDQIIDKLEAKNQKEIDSKLIGQAVLSELKALDKVAYLRFASVYHDFQRVDDFAKELKSL